MPQPNRIRVILAEYGLQIKELAAAADMPYMTVVHIVKGRRPYPDNAYDIVDGINRLTGRNYRFEQVFPNYNRRTS